MRIFSCLILFFTCFLLKYGYGDSLTGGYGLEFEEAIPSDAYNLKTVETVSGTVKEILQFSKASGMGNTVVLLFSLSKTGEIYVVLAPDWFMENQKYRVKEGDYLTITGSLIDYKKKKVMLAAEVERGDQVFKLRDKTTGNADWYEWRKNEEIFYKNYSW